MERDDEKDEKSKPVIEDSTLGDDTKGFQMLANKKAAMQKQPITTTSMQDGLRSLAQTPQFADGGDVPDTQDDGTPTDGAEQDTGFLYRLKALMDSPAAKYAGLMTDPMGALVSAVPRVAAAEAPALRAVGSAGISGYNAMTGSSVPDVAASSAQIPAPGQTTTTQPTTKPHVQSAPASHPLQMASQALAGTPDTNPDIYKGITAGDRLALQRQLMQQQNSPMSLVAKGLSGLGDAVNNSYGNGHSTFAKDNQANMDSRAEQSLSGVDTARAQKLQDIQGPMAAQMADAKSPLAMSMRKTLQSAGLNVPSGMPPSVMLQISGPLGELAMKQATLAVQQQQANAAQSNAGAERRIAAAKDLGDRGIIRKGLDMFDATKSPETQVLQDELHETNGKPAAQSASHGVPDLGSTFNGHKVLSVKRIS